MKTYVVRILALGLVFGLLAGVVWNTQDDETTQTDTPTETVIETPEGKVETKPAVKPVATTPKTPSTTAQPNIQVDAVSDGVTVAATSVTQVKVFAYEYDFDTSAKILSAGEIVFTVHNTGRMTHNFGIRGYKDFGKVIPGESKTFRAVLGSGKWEMYSSKPRDVEMNMTETFTVQ